MQTHDGRGRGVLIAQKVTNNDKIVMVFDTANGGVVRTIDEQNMSYTEMTKADVDRFASQMSGAMAQLQQHMQNMPPEARARMEAMMQGGRGTMVAMGG